MLKKSIKISSIAFYTIFTSTSFLSPAYSEDKVSIENFKYYSEVNKNLAKNSINSIELPEQFLTKSENNFNDIRVFDKNNKETPYILLDNYIPEDRKEKFDLNILDYSESNNKDIVVGELKDKNIPIIDKIFLVTGNQDFNRKIRVYGSNDKNNWTYINQENIYDFSSKISLKKDFIDLNKPSKYKYYKLEIEKLSAKDEDISLKLNYKGIDLNFKENNQQNFRIDSLTVETFAKNKELKLSDIKEIKPEIVNKDKKSTINLKNSLAVEKLDFVVSDPYYYREVNIYSGITEPKLVTKDYIFNLGDTQKNSIELNNPRSENLKIEVENFDNPPLNIQSIKTSRTKKNLFFVSGDSSNYKIYVGNKDISSPNYDISSYINQNNWYKNQYQQFAINNVIDNKSFKASFSSEDRYKIQNNILTGLVFLVVIILGFWIYRMMKDVKVNNG